MAQLQSPSSEVLAPLWERIPQMEGAISDLLRKGGIRLHFSGFLRVTVTFPDTPSCGNVIRGFDACTTWA